MTNRERLLKTLRGEIPDCVPVAPDFSNMIPARMTGMPFWDLYLYNKIPVWKAYINCAKHFDIDALMDGYFPLCFEENESDLKQYIVYKDEDRIVTRHAREANGKHWWQETVDVFYRADPPSRGVSPDKINLPQTPDRFELVEGVEPFDRSPAGFRKAKELMGDQGLIGVFLAGSCALSSEEDIYNYYDHEDKHEEWAAERVAAVEKRFNQIMAMEVLPDFVCVGGSGTLIYQTVEIFRQLALPAVKRAIELCEEAGMMTHIHSCGPESELVRIMAEETSLTVIDPLEVAPMGDCQLADLKEAYGNRLTLKGNLHTTEVMLRGSVDEVKAASRQAIDDAAAGGRFILSTGDQCGRDTPDENLFAMIETARTYGRYREDGTVVGE